jgi:hypothetical protein
LFENFSLRLKCKYFLARSKYFFYQHLFFIHLHQHLDTQTLSKTAMRPNQLQAVGVICTTLLTLTMNYLANALPLNGQTSAMVSAKFPTYFTPAGFAFSIWGVIYLGLIAFTVYQALPAQIDNPRLVKIRKWVMLNGLCNSVWLPLFHYEYIPASVVVMLGLLYTLVQINVILNQESSHKNSEKWFIEVPFSIYWGWICVATVANVSILLTTTTWFGFGVSAPMWSVVMIVVAAVIGSWAYLKIPNLAYILVFVWAFFAIFKMQADTVMVAKTALIAAGAVGLVIGLRALRVFSR